MDHAIELLGHHRHLVPLVARWHWDEWGAAYPASDYPEASLDEWTRQLAQKTSIDSLPCSWIAFVREAPVGWVVLELDGVEPRPELTPDLGGLFVLPEYRNNGIGSALVRAWEEGARARGIDEIYLYTERAETLYSRLGWETIERTHFLGLPAAIMRKRLTLPPTTNA